MKHQIVEYNWRNPENITILKEREFSKLFSKIAMKWFESYAIKRYQEPQKIQDATLAGVHYEIGDLVMELR